MDDQPPDRLSNDPGSPFYDAALLERGIGIRFKGVEKNNVEEYCVSEGWVRVAHATAKDPQRQPHDHQAQWRGRAVFPDRQAGLSICTHGVRRRSHLPSC